MNNCAQRSGMRWMAFAILFVFSWAGCGDTPATTVIPLVGHAQDAVYCHAVLQALAAAESRVDALLSSVSMDDNPLIPALADAARRGVAVRVLLDASSWAPSITARNLPALTYLQEHGVDARFDHPDITLHAKLVIVDEATVILGSSNWNRYAFTEHRQADVLLVDCSIAEFYRAYFDLLWDDNASSTSIAIDPLPAAGATIIPLADLPDSTSYVSVVLDLLGRAQTSVHIVMYRISYYTGYGESTSNQLMDAVAAAAHRGLDVKVLIDDCANYIDSAQANLSAALRLAQLGVDVRLDAPEITTHAKLIIIDGHCVILGSTNWNYYALEKNYETAVVFLYLPEIAKPFEQFFLSLWETARQLAL